MLAVEIVDPLYIILYPKNTVIIWSSIVYKKKCGNNQNLTQQFIPFVNYTVAEVSWQEVSVSIQRVWGQRLTADISPHMFVVSSFRAFSSTLLSSSVWESFCSLMMTRSHSVSRGLFGLRCCRSAEGTIRSRPWQEFGGWKRHLKSEYAGGSEHFNSCEKRIKDFSPMVSCSR